MFINKKRFTNYIFFINLPSIRQAWLKFCLDKYLFVLRILKIKRLDALKSKRKVIKLSATKLINIINDVF